MNIRLAAASVVALSLASCAAPDSAAEGDGTWVGTITTEGNVTTVTNESGSVWGGAARLVEEASIGVDAGDDPYMFGRVSGIWASKGEIYVLDQQVPALRVFSFDGTHLRDIGREGQGPGEFTAPAFITGTADGRILVLDARRRDAVIVYDEAGVALDPIRLEGLHQCCTHPMVAMPDGSLWLEMNAARIALTGRDLGFGRLQRFVQLYDDGGAVGPPRPVPLLGYEPVTFRVADIEREYSVPLSPEHIWAMSPDGVLIVGVSDAYTFEKHHPDGTLTRIVRETTPVEVLDAEAEWHRKLVLGSYGWTPEGERRTLVWNEAIPATKPAFTRFVPTASGGVWVYRPGPAQLIPDCTVGPIAHSGLRRAPDRCHRDTRIIDVFDETGRYLGAIDPPERMILVSPFPFIRDDNVFALVASEDGVSRLKRYRVVLPSNE